MPATSNNAACGIPPASEIIPGLELSRSSSRIADGCTIARRLKRYSCVESLIALSMAVHRGERGPGDYVCRWRGSTGAALAGSVGLYWSARQHSLLERHVRRLREGLLRWACYDGRVAGDD